MKYYVETGRMPGKEWGPAGIMTEQVSRRIWWPRSKLIDGEPKRGSRGPKKRVAEAFAPQQLRIGRSVSPSNLTTSTNLGLCVTKDPKEDETSAVEVPGRIVFSL